MTDNDKRKTTVDFAETASVENSQAAGLSSDQKTQMRIAFARINAPFIAKGITMADRIFREPNQDI